MEHLPEELFPEFGAFDAAASSTSSLLPAGGAYNLMPDVALTGAFEDWGAPRCRFGSVEVPASSVGAWLRTTAVSTPHRTATRPASSDAAHRLRLGCAGRAS